MSASAVVHRDEVLELLGRVRDLLPAELRQARALLEEREQLLAEGREAAARLQAEAIEERAELVERSSVHRQAQAEADALLTAARAQADALRAEVEDYVDGKLANMEIVLGKTLEAVQRGRARLSGASELDELRGD